MLSKPSKQMLWAARGRQLALLERRRRANCCRWCTSIKVTFSALAGRQDQPIAEPIYRVRLEAGMLTQHLTYRLTDAGSDVVCMDAR